MQISPNTQYSSNWLDVIDCTSHDVISQRKEFEFRICWCDRASFYGYNRLHFINLYYITLYYVILYYMSAFYFVWNLRTGLYGKPCPKKDTKRIKLPHFFRFRSLNSYWIALNEHADLFGNVNWIQKMTKKTSYALFAVKINKSVNKWKWFDVCCVVSNTERVCMCVNSFHFFCLFFLGTEYGFSERREPKWFYLFIYSVYTSVVFFYFFFTFFLFSFYRQRFC